MFQWRGPKNPRSFKWPVKPRYVAENYYFNAWYNRIVNHFEEGKIDSAEFLRRMNITLASDDDNQVREALDFIRPKPRERESKVDDIKEYIGESKDPLLDIGAMDGVMTAEIAEYTQTPIDETFALDIRPVENVNVTGIEYTKLNKIPLRSCSIQNIFLLQLTHHVKDLAMLSSEIARVNRPGGLVIIKDHDCIANTDYLRLIRLTHLYYQVLHQEEFELDLIFRSKDDLLSYFPDYLIARNVDSNSPQRIFVTILYRRQYTNELLYNNQLVSNYLLSQQLSIVLNFDNFGAVARTLQLVVQEIAAPPYINSPRDYLRYYLSLYSLWNFPRAPRQHLAYPSLRYVTEDSLGDTTHIYGVKI